MRMYLGIKVEYRVTLENWERAGIPQSSHLVIYDFLSDWLHPQPKPFTVGSGGDVGAPKRTKCSLAGQEDIQEHFLEEARIPGGLELQRRV